MTQEQMMQMMQMQGFLPELSKYSLRERVSRPAL